MTPMRLSFTKNVYTMLSLPVIALCFLALPGFITGGLASSRPRPVEPVAPTVAFDVCITDGTTHDNVQFSSTTGAYLFTRCSDGFTLSGTGAVRTSGSVIVLTDKQPDRLLRAAFLSNQKTGRAGVSRIVGKGVFQTTTIVQNDPSTPCGCLVTASSKNPCGIALLPGE